jgi:hypothetical protein
MTQPSLYWTLCYECSEPTNIQQSKVVREVFVYCEHCYETLEEEDKN